MQRLTLLSVQAMWAKGAFGWLYAWWRSGPRAARGTRRRGPHAQQTANGTFVFPIHAVSPCSPHLDSFFEWYLPSCTRLLGLCKQWSRLCKQYASYLLQNQDDEELGGV